MSEPDIMISPMAIVLDPLYADWMFMYGDDGLVINGDPIYPGAPFVDLTGIVGLDSAPIRDTEREREGMDGGFLDAAFESMRSIILKGTVYGNENDLEPYMDQLKANFAPVQDPKPLYHRVPFNGIRVVFCKSLGISYDITQARRYGRIDFQISLKAEDPAIYGEQTIADVELKPFVAGGRGYNRAYNYGYSTTDQTLPYVTVYNLGNKPANAQLNIYGPVINPSVLHEQSDTTMQFVISLNEQEMLSIDLRNRTVRLNGQANRRNTLKGRAPWFLLNPGMNTFRFFGQPDSPTVAPRLEVISRPAYR